MDALIETFHIDVKILIAQVINFAIVFSVLYFFAIKPLLKVMQDREKTIEKAQEDAKNIERKLNKTDEDYRATVANAKKEANEIIEKSRQDATKKGEEMIKKAKDEIGHIIAKEKEKQRLEKEETLNEIKKEVAGMVVASVEKVLNEKIDDKKDVEFIKKMVK